MELSNTYSQANPEFSQASQPTTVQNPQLFLWNIKLAKQLKIPEKLASKPQNLAAIFSGNQILAGSEPVATAYAGHQFGHFVPQLGDGRAHLLGDLSDLSGQKWDVQLKGSGPTPFSRGGDGRCGLGPAVREYIMSEALFALGVPTTRCLAVVISGEQIFRETPIPGAIVTRVAASHLRVGTFQYFAAQGKHEIIQDLCDFAIQRHYPQLMGHGSNRYIALLAAVIQKQIELVVHWLRVGFIHGVMNTDNTTLSGETIDYGPCAMMNVYDPQTVYSSIDTQGRYAYGNQAAIAQWNMARLAECLLPLIDDDQTKAISQLEPIITDYSNQFEQAYHKMMGHKLGLKRFKAQDEKLLSAFLDLLIQNKMDYTNTFDMLTNSLQSSTETQKAKSQLGDWYEQWRQRLTQQNSSLEHTHQMMRENNPILIPRNHHMEAVLKQSLNTGQASAAEQFLKVLRSPYTLLPESADYQSPPADADQYYQTFCGT